MVLGKRAIQGPRKGLTFDYPAGLFTNWIGIGYAATFMSNYTIYEQPTTPRMRKRSVSKAPKA